MGLMTEFDLVRNATDDGYDVEWLNTVTFACDITDRLGGFIEFTYLAARGPDRATFDCGLTYAIGRHVQLDAGACVGLTRAADDVTFFSGLAYRF